MDLDRERSGGAFVGAAKEELERIEADIADAERAAGSFAASDSAKAETWRAIAELGRKRRELFAAEHDQAGAFKIKKFDRQIRDFFFANEREKRRQVIEQDEDGMFRLAGGQEGRKLMFVDLLELARLNKEGGHDAGDLGLEGTVEAIKETVLASRDEASKDFRFDIFRSGGNQFMVSFDGIDETAFASIYASLSTRRIDVAEKAGREVEPAPIVVSTMDFGDLVEDLNVMQSATGERFAPGADASREMMAVLARNAEWRGDVGKFTAYAERVIEKLESSETEAETYFNQFVKKYFEGTRFARFDDLKGAVAEGEIDRVVREEALGAIRAKFAKERALDAAELDHLDSGMRELIREERVSARWRGPATGEYRALGEDVGETETRKTSGETLLASRKEAVVATEGVLREVEKLNGVGTAEAERARFALENAKIELDIETARRNLGTGLLERGVYYERLEAALKEDRDVTSVFVDMGFLKYFDEDGGRDVGDRALLAAARLMERAVEEAGITAEVFRYGGDEFTVLIDGDKADATTFERKLSELKKETGIIPPGPKSKPAYVATELQFNSGVADRRDLEDSLAASGRRDAEWNKRAELLTRAADVAVEYRKAIDRIDYLVDQLRQTPDGRLTPDIEAKMARSAKVTEPDKGGETLIRTFADELRHLESLPEGEREAVRQEIEERSLTYVLNGIEARRSHEKDEKRVLDAFIEARSFSDFLRAQITKLSKASVADRATIDALEKRLKTSQAELEGLRSARSRLAA